MRSMKGKEKKRKGMKEGEKERQTVVDGDQEIKDSERCQNNG